jgi:hypothetical protein
VDVLVDGHRTRRVRVTANKLYTLADFGRVSDHTLEVRLGRGLAAYAFTFGSEAQPGAGRPHGLRPTGTVPS